MIVFGLSDADALLRGLAQALVQLRHLVHRLPDFVKSYGVFPVFYVCVAIILHLLLSMKRARDTSGISGTLKRLWWFIVPKEVVTKRSFVVDLQFWFFVNLGVAGFIGKWLTFVFLLNHMPAVFSYLHVDSNWLVTSIRSNVNELDRSHKMLVIFVVAFISHDFSSYWAHWITHKSNVLWSFHKIHHYSEQINVMAGYRFHPVDSFFQFAVMGPFTAAMISIVAPLDRSTFYSSYSPYLSNDWPWYAAFMLYTLFSRLVHSHFPIYFGKFFGKILVSPAFHMLHHSKLAVGKNYGGAFAIWDYLFGTYCDISSVEEYNQHSKNLGVRGIPDDAYSSIVQALYVPFRDAYLIVKGRIEARTTSVSS